MTDERHYWRYRVHVEHWDGYVNMFFDSLKDAEGYRERMLKKDYVTSVTLAEQPLPKKPAREVGAEMYQEMVEDRMARKAREGSK